MSARSLARKSYSEGTRGGSDCFRGAGVILASVLAALSVMPSLRAVPRIRHRKLAPDLAEILSRMNDTAKHLKTVSANLEYTKVTVLVNDKSTDSGQLFFHKSKTPEILIKFEKPVAKTILFKKNRAEIYMPKTNQIQEYDLGQHSGLVQQFFLLGFGTETGELKKSYDLKYLNEEDLEGDTTAVLQLTPRRGSVESQLSRIDLWVSEESWIPVQQKFYELDGDYSIARYKAVKVNRHIPPSTFYIEAPSGAKRVKMR